MTAATRFQFLAPSAQRTLVTGILALTLVAWVCTTAVLAIGGRPDPPRLRAVAPLIDGPWKFHVGDDPRWAGIAADDSSWETLDLSAPASSIDGDVGLPNYVGGWMAHGHSGYQGYAWYRRSLVIPEGDRVWDILGPTAVEDGYELYWNGKRLGGSGRLGQSPRVVGTRPMIFSLPADAAGTQGVIAIRTFMQPGSVAVPASGGIHVAPTLAPQPESRELYRVQWWRTVAGYIVEVVEPLAMAMVIVLALSLRPLSSHQSFIAFVCVALLLSAVKRLDNAIVSWTDLLSLPAYTWLNNVLWMPLSLAAWALSWNRWALPPSRGIDAGALVLAALGIAGGVMGAVWGTQVFRLGTLALLVLVAARIARNGPMRGMALTVLLVITISQYTSELGSLGVPTIWFPFGIGVTLTQYVYGIAIPLLAVLIVRTVATAKAVPGRWQ
ncbi:glycoside hydrolase family 2 [Stenotrophomonas sp. CC22-02]|uniref:glycoside hydrolase family 2 n=1 Tax=Stenotrophomonas sp. CC22-02 TaxID=1378087 RepID=UPI0010EB49AE|nr:glycoside hydrolase family 2 [Stenotrophomonas sp. CC22-02]TDV30766.1 hypothetical protein N440_1603 [Stenotrophomonas sp. CC22-02]